MADFCEQTRAAFADMFQKPPLTDELLQRPPFKFVHDVIGSTIKATGFLQGIYTADELDHKTIKDKDAKIAFLQKAVDAVSQASGSKIDVKPAKIVAGKDADKTNAFLQVMAKCARGEDSGLASSSGGSAGSSKENRNAITNGHDAGLAQKSEKKSKDKDKKHKSKDNEDGGEKPKKPRDKSKDGKEKKHREHKSKDREKEPKDKDKEKKHHKEKDKEKPAKERSHSKEKAHKKDKTDGESSKKRSHHSAQDESEPPARRPGTSMGRPQTSMGRPGTAMARPAPPKLKRKELGEVEAKPVPALAGGGETSNLITADDSNKAADDADNFLVEEPLAAPVIDDSMMDDHADADQLDAEEHGVLVRKILETKKELEGGLDADSKGGKVTSVVFDEKEREKTRREAQKMQQFIQHLTRNAHPLGRLLDYMQEDMDSMLKELEQWRSEYRKNSSKLREAYGAAEGETEPLRLRLVELDAQIKETREAISTTRGNIIANEEKLRNMITSVGK